MSAAPKIKSAFRHPAATLRNLWQYCLYKPRFRRYSLGNRIGRGGRITHRHISLGKNVRLGPRCRIQGITRYLNDRFCPEIILADNVSIQQDFYLTCASRVAIGRNTAIAAFVTITDIDHPYSDIHTPIENQPLRIADVEIGSGCKIYNGAVITCGTHIGHHCVVGANSVVKGRFPDFCVIAGNPARVIKRYNEKAGEWQRTLPGGEFISK